MFTWLENAFGGGSGAGLGIDLETGHERFNDYSRRYITYFLILLLACIIVFALFDTYEINGQPTDVGAATVNSADAKADADRLVQVLNILFGPVVTLLGTATGFYFGTKSQGASAGSAGLAPPPPAPPPVAPCISPDGSAAGPIPNGEPVYVPLDVAPSAADPLAAGQSAPDLE